MIRIPKEEGSTEVADRLEALEHAQYPETSDLLVTIDQLIGEEVMG